jgi:hypothetical protein
MVAAAEMEVTDVRRVVDGLQSKKNGQGSGGTRDLCAMRRTARREDGDGGESAAGWEEEEDGDDGSGVRCSTAYDSLLALSSHMLSSHSLCNGGDRGRSDAALQEESNASLMETGGASSHEGESTVSARLSCWTGRR